MAFEPLFHLFRPANKLASALLGHKVILKGLENVPRKTGALFTINHTGYLDFYFSAMGLTKCRRQPRYMAKQEIFENSAAGPIMRHLKQIPVDRIAGRGSMNHAVQMLKDGEAVCIFPEGTMSQSWEIKELKTGAVRMAQEAGVDIYPIIVWGSHRVWRRGVNPDFKTRGIGIIVSYLPAFDPTGDPDEVSERLREVMRNELDVVRAEYEEKFGPFEPGLPWMPASLGGSAPTLAEAQAEDDRVEADRARARSMMRESKKAASDVHMAVMQLEKHDSDKEDDRKKLTHLQELREAAERLAQSAEEISQASKMQGEEVKRKAGEGSLRYMTETVATAAMELERATLLSGRKANRSWGRHSDSITDFASDFRHRATKNLYAGADFLAKKAQDLLNYLEGAERTAKVSSEERAIRHAIAREARIEQATADAIREENRDYERRFKRAQRKADAEARAEKRNLNAQIRDEVKALHEQAKAIEEKMRAEAKVMEDEARESVAQTVSDAASEKHTSVFLDALDAVEEDAHDSKESN
ncbi:MAG TPA: hypothetical protein GX530_03370 [Corynebacteriales bacterium]|nr:hypothetical protein [Mycobacteriales bacterium]